jgi:hypothetical protein
MVGHTKQTLKSQTLILHLKVKRYHLLLVVDAIFGKSYLLLPQVANLVQNCLKANR